MKCRSAAAVLTLAVSLISPRVWAQSPFLFETATLGPVGVQGLGIFADADQYIGAKFEVSEQTNVENLGGHIFADGFSSGSVFAAVVPLDPVTDLPSTLDLSDAIFSTLFLPPRPSEEVVLDVDFELAPGRYGLVFGSGQWGATGAALMPENNEDIGEPEYFSIAFIGSGSPPTWGNAGFRSCRFFVVGNSKLFADGFESGDTASWSLP